MNLKSLSSDGKIAYLIKPILKVLQDAGGQLERSEIKERISDLDDRIAEYSEWEKTSELTGNTYREFDFNFNFAIKDLYFNDLLTYTRLSPITLTESGLRLDIGSLDVQKDIIETSKIHWEELNRKNKKNKKNKTADIVGDEEEPQAEEKIKDTFKDNLLTAISKMSPKKFEAFSRALLNRMGVEFTEKGAQISNDGGIDGYGYHTDTNDFRTTRVVIQCKRYNAAPISEPEINQFLGAMNKYQADYGVFITNGRFTNAARTAAREGSPITLIDGNDLVRLVIKYELYGDNKVNVGFTQANREQGIRRLTAINLMKRMESSVYSFNLTLTRIKDLINSTIETIDRFDKHSGTTLDLTDISDMDEFDAEDQNSDELFSFGRKVKIDLADMDYVSWRDSLAKDADVLELLTLLVGDITPEHDSKLQELFRVIDNKITHPINEDNKKLIIFTAFADTAGYLYDNVSRYVKDRYGLNTAMVSGSVEGRTTCPKLRADLNTVLTCFSPISKDKELLMPGDKTEIDVLIATDCISEGQNLQDCDYLINYDIHWNPVRIIQRFGRIDRIGSRNKVIQLVNFWPDVTLDDYINLKAKVETRMKIVDMTATGDDNLLSDEEKTDLEYRKAQLKRLQDEVVDIEDMTTGISIMDLGLNEFRLDLLDYIKHHPDIDKTPFGLHSVVPASEDTPAGVIYVLKNRSNSVNIDNQNRLHPFYMVYIGNDGEVICDHLSPKQMLDKMRFLCKGKTEPIPEAYKPFNKETRDGRNMSQLSKLLGDAIASIIEVKDESDIDSFLGGGQVSFLSNEIKGLDDFELICFLVVR